MRGGASMAASAEGQEDLDFEKTRLYEQTPLVAEGMLPVSDLHTIAWFEYGNPAGKPVIFVHGGPGGGTAPMNARYFNPEAYRIILMDQRGCGKSTPFAELKENTVWDLIDDIEKLREKLGIEKWQVFGGSWGSTLSLAYAITHPQRVTELVLRGIFLLRKKELDFFYEGVGTAFLFPEEWEAFQAAIPEEERAGGFIEAYGRRLRGELGEEEKFAASKAWSIWEGSVSRLNVPTREAILKKWGDDDFALAFARIENHYFTGKDGVPGFFPRDGWLLEEENLAKIAHIPTVIVQGRYDVVCPAVSAYELHKRLPNSTLHMTTTGHSSFEPEIIEKLVEATDKFAGITPPNHAVAAADLHNLLLTRRTVNSFRAELPVGWEDALQRAILAATFAPNHKNTEPWRFHLLGPESIRRVCELNAEIVSSTKGPEAGAKKLKRWLAMPGWLVVSCVRSESDAGSMDNPNGVAREDYAACCCAVQNLCLSLHADGIGTKWTSGDVNFDARFAEAVGLPSNEYVIGTIWFGQAEKQPPAPVKKLSLEDVLHRHD